MAANLLPLDTNLTNQAVCDYYAALPAELPLSLDGLKRHIMEFKLKAPIQQWTLPFARELMSRILEHCSGLPQAVQKRARPAPKIKDPPKSVQEQTREQLGRVENEMAKLVSTMEKMSETVNQLVEQRMDPVQAQDINQMAYDVIRMKLAKTAFTRRWKANPYAHYLDTTQWFLGWLKKYGVRLGLNPITLQENAFRAALKKKVSRRQIDLRNGVRGTTKKRCKELDAFLMAQHHDPHELRELFSDDVRVLIAGDVLLKKKWRAPFNIPDAATIEGINAQLPRPLVELVYGMVDEYLDVREGLVEAADADRQAEAELGAEEDFD